MNRRALLASAAAFSLLPSLAGAQGLDPTYVDALNRYLNGITTMQGNFTQQSPDGRVAEGKFYMSRPGRLRFEYADPYPTVVVADGYWAGVINREARTLNQIPLNQTPLYLLLDSDIDLGASGAIRSIERGPGVIRVKAIDPGKPNEGSITMIFSTSPVELLKWVITDGSGRSSVISLRDVQRGMYIQPTVFVIEDPSGTGRFTTGEGNRG